MVDITFIVTADSNFIAINNFTYITIIDFTLTLFQQPIFNYFIYANLLTPN